MKIGIPEFLPQNKKDELNQIVELIEERYKKVNMIILYGSYARNTWVEDRYEENGTTFEYISDYDLLIVMGSENKAKGINFQIDMRNHIERLEIKTPVSLIFHGYPYIGTMLAERRYFFCDLYKEGYVLSNVWDRQFKEPTEIPYHLRVEKAQNYFDEWFDSANEFMIDFENCFNRENYKKASFELHQAVERFFMTISLVFTDYKPKIHNLFKLNKMVCDEDKRFRQVFPEATEEEKRLFELLKDAYIGSRYNHNFQITKSDLEYLSTRVELLKKLTEKICKEKIEYFKSHVE